MCVGNLGLGLHGLYNAINCVVNILGRLTMNVRVNSFTNLKKRWILGFAWMLQFLPNLILILFGKQFHDKIPHTANARLPKVSCVNFGNFRTHLTIIGSDNGSSPGCAKPSSEPLLGHSQLDLRENNQWNISRYLNIFISRKGVCKCRLENYSYFVWTSGFIPIVSELFPAVQLAKVRHWFM